VKKIFPISFKLNLTPNTLGCKGLSNRSVTFKEDATSSNNAIKKAVYFKDPTKFSASENAELYSAVLRHFSGTASHQRRYGISQDVVPSPNCQSIVFLEK